MRLKMLPVAFACSGCSSAGQLADHVVRHLDEQGLVEMGSIAGIGADEPLQLGKARSRFPIYAVDGCANACSRRCLERQGIKPLRHVVLTDFGVLKRCTAGFDQADAKRLLDVLATELR
jgi:uncharacterized metal-binding protein